jgi:imidazole glycerol-phosphate synthase subunit HisF
MRRTRIIPCLLLRDQALVKTVKFRDARYVGDPINAVRIFNEKEVDELVCLDISATPAGRRPSLELIATFADECFMPLCYGGGVRTLEDVQAILGSGVEKVALNSVAAEEPEFVRRATERFGGSSIVVSMDVKKGRFGGYEVLTHGGTRRTGFEPVTYAARMEALGAGELLLTSIDRDGTGEGYDIDLVRRVADAVSVPVVASGGAGRLEHLGEVASRGGASAAAAGSFFVFQGRHRAVLISYPTQEELAQVVA